MTRSISKKVADPKAHFSDWYYRIEEHHFETLGVTLREFVKDKVPYTSFAIQSPPDFQFLRGYIFYSSLDPSCFLQIAAETDLFGVEVHIGKTDDPAITTLGYVVSIADCAAWLRTGEIPVANKVIDLASSKAGLLAWQLLDKTTPPLTEENASTMHMEAQSDANKP